MSVLHSKSYSFPYIYSKVFKFVTKNRLIPFYNGYELNFDVSYELSELINILTTVTDMLTVEQYTEYLARFGVDVVFGITENRSVACFYFRQKYEDGCNYKVHDISFIYETNTIIFSVDYIRHRHEPKIEPSFAGYFIK
jgi:hypothetical protein